MKVDRTTVYIACTVGMLCSLAGIWQTLRGSVAVGSALVLVSLVIAGLVWKHLHDVRRDLEQRG